MRIAEKTQVKSRQVDKLDVKKYKCLNMEDALDGILSLKTALYLSAIK